MRRFASLLLGLGAAIGGVGAIGLAVGFEPSRLPSALIDISVYKLVFIAAAAVLGSGAVVMRAERRYRAADESKRVTATSVDARRGAELGEGDPAEALRRRTSARDRERDGS
jgi:hypothetical protein